MGPKTIDDIPADETLTMTPILIRAFRAVGCIPSCHCCLKDIAAGQDFKLATVRAKHKYDMENTDQMLCGKCTPQMMVKSINTSRKYWEAQGRGYSRPSRTQTRSF